LRGFIAEGAERCDAGAAYQLGKYFFRLGIHVRFFIRRVVGYPVAIRVHELC
jgi:hypothetical protein